MFCCLSGNVWDPEKESCHDMSCKKNHKDKQEEEKRENKNVQGAEKEENWADFQSSKNERIH